MRALGSRPTRDRGEETTVRRTIIGFIITCALGCLCVAPLAPEAQPPTHVHRIGALTGYTLGACPRIRSRDSLTPTLAGRLPAHRGHCPYPHLVCARP